jgi:DNA-binding transcriptional regulator of glucitol operon
MKKFLLVVMVIMILAIGVMGIHQIYRVNRAHSTFANYYAFRGCSQLISQTATSATCALPSGQVIEIVEYENKWYLNGDLPCTGPLGTYLLCMI